MKIAFISAEVAPFSKVGGLADVAGSLPLALDKLGITVSIFTPFYQGVHLNAISNPVHNVYSSIVNLGKKGAYQVDVFKKTIPSTSIDVFFLKNKHFFGRSGIYTDPSTRKEYVDNAYRFAFFMRSILQFIKDNKIRFDVIHCNDSHTAMIPALLKLMGKDNSFANTGTLLTIHNLAYQGLYEKEVLDCFSISEKLFYPMGPLEFFGKVSFLKAGIYYSDVINTVSPTYAREIQQKEFGCGLEGILKERASDVFGILNGVDSSVWNPEVDPLIPHNYDVNYVEGKLVNKKYLLNAYGFNESDIEVPVISIISRLVDQKGIDLIVDILPALSKEKVVLLVLGTGLSKYHAFFKEARKKWPNMLGVKLEFNNELAHLIEAGSDMFLMPSLYEPCGLNQMYSMIYGTVPIVRQTGGLADTVTPFDLKTGTGTGFAFKPYSPDELLKEIKKALNIFRDKTIWLQIVVNGMKQNFSWTRSAKEYIKLYSLIKEKVYSEKDKFRV